MKKVIFVSMFSLSLYAEVSLEERLEEAIRKSDAPMVNQLLRNFDQDAMPKAQKKSLVADLSELAQSVARAKKSHRGFFKNNKDLGLGAIGSAAALIASLRFGHACLILYERCKRKDYNGEPSYTWAEVLLTKRYEPFLFGGGFWGSLSVLGSYLAYKGLTCSAQKSEVDQAQVICKAFEDKKEELGL